MNLSDLKYIEEEPVAMFFLDLMFLIAPGISLIFYFYQDIFLALDVLKLILLSISFIAPLISVNTVIFLIRSSGGKGETLACLTVGAFFANLIFYFALFISYLFKFSLKTTIFEIIIFEIIFIISIFTWFHKLSKKP